MLSSETEITGRGQRPGGGRRVCAGPAECELPLRLPHGNIKSSVGSVGLEFREEAESGNINFHVSTELWIRV